MSNPSVTLTYKNPIYPGYFADPFVWRYHGEYYAVGTGPVEASGEIEEAESAASASPRLVDGRLLPNGLRS